MTLSNHLTAQHLISLQAQEIAALPASELARLQAEADALLRNAKAIVAHLSSALTLKYGAHAYDLRRQTGKPFGILRFADGEITVTSEIDKKVDWNQAQLAALCDRIRNDGQDPAEFLDITFKVPEGKFTAWPAPLRAAFEPARTVRPGPQTLKLRAPDAP